jgi:chaperone required for assembly of F1-ATPase
MSTVFGQGGVITLNFNTTQHEATCAGVREIISTTGGIEFTTADGIVHRTTQTSTVTAVEVTMYQDLTSTNLWRYLRETTPTTGTLIVGGTSSLTEGGTNPEWNYAVSGWTDPELNWTAGGISTVTATFTVTGVTVDTTP